ncbi:MAG: NADH:flavin oxidoreductase/NADH oxidase family protein [Pseudomonadota bacterium]
MTVSINSPLTLPSGLELKNRLVKAAMTEGLADARNCATERHQTLYRRWAEGGLGLQLTGNVQIDRRHLERPGNVVIDGKPANEAMAKLAAWAEAGKADGCKMIMQISHAGRQTPKSVNERPRAPSPVALNMPGGVFGAPRAMTGDEVKRVIEGFGNAATVAKAAGFDGVQIHAAHGYLISQFLSPISNQRDDEWGGPLENRARLLVEAVKAAKASAGDGFAVGVKLNSSDFQKGGFSHEDCLAVVDMLGVEAIDFLEVSGGNYEQPKMAGIEGMEPVFDEPVRESTRAREAYFANYARSVKARASMPVLVTGGFRTRSAMDAALEDGEADLIGLGRPLCADTDTPRKLLEGVSDAEAWESKLRLGPGRLLGPHSPIGLIKGLNGWGAQGWFCLQLQRMADGQDPDLKLGVFKAFRTYQASEAKAAKAYHAALEAA